MKTFVKKHLFPDPYPSTFNEEEYLISEIEKAKEKLHAAWNRFEYAAPEYVDLAVLELLLAENHYGLLNKRYRLYLGLNTPSLLSSRPLESCAFYEPTSPQ